MRLGDMLRAWRRHHEISQRDLAKQIGINVNTIFRLEKHLDIKGHSLAIVMTWLLQEVEHG